MCTSHATRNFGKSSTQFRCHRLCQMMLMVEDQREACHCLGSSHEHRTWRRTCTSSQAILLYSTCQRNDLQICGRSCLSRFSWCFKSMIRAVLTLPNSAITGSTFKFQDGAPTEPNGQASSWPDLQFAPPPITISLHTLFYF
jgi:hypothetical protein